MARAAESCDGEPSPDGGQVLVSDEAIQGAHTNPGVLAMWDEFGKVCDYVPVAQVPETADLFSNFTPLS